MPDFTLNRTAAEINAQQTNVTPLDYAEQVASGKASVVGQRYLYDGDADFTALTAAALPASPYSAPTQFKSTFDALPFKQGETSTPQQKYWYQPRDAQGNPSAPGYSVYSETSTLMGDSPVFIYDGGDWTTEEIEELRRNHDPKGWGIVFNGDESAKVQTLIDEVGVIKVPANKSLTAYVSVSKGFSLIGEDRSSRFIGGITQLDNTIASNVIFKSITLELYESQFYGGISTSSRAENIQYVDLKIITKKEGVTTLAAKNCDGFVIRDVDLTTDIPNGKNQQYMFSIASVSQFDISNLNAKGATEFGFESGGDGSGATPACWDGNFENITIQKSGGEPSQSGHHGWYLHGFKNVTAKNINITGWNDPNYDWKVREGTDGDFTDINCGRAFVNSNGGSGLQELKKLTNCKFRNFKPTDFGVLGETGSDLGRGIENIEFHGTTGNFGFNMTSFVKNITVSGIYERFQSNLSGSSDGFNLKYKNCTIRSDVNVDGSFKFEGQPNFESCTLECDLYLENSSLRVRQTTIQGALKMNPTSGSYSLEMINSHATGELFAYTYSSRNIEARIYNSSFGANERSASTENPSTKKYRGVGFDDGFYTTENNKIT